MARKIIGWALVAFGAIGFAVEIQNVVAGTTENTVVGLVMASFFLAGGLALLLRRRRGATPAALPAATLEPRLFRFAQRQRGRVSAVEASAALGLPFDTCRALLDDLARRGACEPQVNDAGAVFYRFAELEGPEAKRDLLEAGPDGEP